MKKALALFLICVAGSAFAAGPEATIKSVHDRFSSAMQAGKFEQAKKVILSNFASDFVRNGKGGVKENLQQFVKNLAPPPGAKISQFKFSYGKVATKGNAATVTVSVSVKGTMKDEKGKTHTMEGASVEKETWTKSGATWKLKQMDGISEKSIIDGKVIGG